MRVQGLAVFRSDEAVHIHRLTRHAMYRQRMTADDKQRMREAAEKIEQRLHFYSQLSGKRVDAEAFNQAAATAVP